MTEEEPVEITVNPAYDASTKPATKEPASKRIRLEILTDTESQYTVDLQYDPDKGRTSYWDKKKGDSRLVLNHAVYLSRGLLMAFEKRASTLHKMGNLDDSARINLIQEYQDTGIELLCLMLMSKHLFKDSRVVYIDPETGKISKSGVVLKIKKAS